MHTKRKTIKSYLLGAQVSALSEEIEKLSDFFLQIWLPDRAMVIQIWPFLVFLYNSSLSGGQICKKNIDFLR